MKLSYGMPPARPPALPLRHPDMIRLTGRHPFNTEPPPARLFDSYLTPPTLHYVRNHGAAPRIKWEAHRLMVNGELGCGHQQSACRSSFTTIHCAQGCGSRAMPVAHFPPPRRPLPPPTAGLVDTPTTFTMDDLLAMPSIDVTCTLTCAGACCCRTC